MSTTLSLHYNLCLEGAKWLFSRKNHEGWQSPWRYVWVEPSLVGENPDIWAFNGERTICVEVKVSHADFIADKKKWCRKEENTRKVGCYRYYLAPKGVISNNELPDGWGLLEWDGTIIRGKYNIVRTVVAPIVHKPSEGDLHIIGSLLRREKLRHGIYNYRGTPTTIKSKR